MSDEQNVTKQFKTTIMQWRFLSQIPLKEKKWGDRYDVEKGVSSDAENDAKCW